MKVRNINGTTDNSCKCGSWLDHWKRFSGQPVPSYCPEVNCHNRPSVGAHVQKAGDYSDKWYIVPLCYTHNSSKSDLEIDSNIKLVSANKKETCDK